MQFRGSFSVTYEKNFKNIFVILKKATSFMHIEYYKQNLMKDGGQMNKKMFIDTVKEGAIKGQREYSILPSLTIAQAILESGWGRSQLAVKAKNLFGIKAFANWTGKRITFPTTEWYHGREQVVNADFRAYDSFGESVEDHNKLLSSSRYKSVRDSKDYRAACREIFNCGYATDPVYSEKLIKIIEENMLYKFDNENSVNEVALDIDNQKIRRFQQLCNALGIKDSEGECLAEDNILGPKTRSCIGRMPILRFDSKGAAVEFIQEVLKVIPVDGEFGPVTGRAVKNYQLHKNITSDGIVGLNTWTMIMTK
jgi:flagellum-specific peptidoglycan hydrolase FlgJ